MTKKYEKVDYVAPISLSPLKNQHLKIGISLGPYPDHQYQWKICSHLTRKINKILIFTKLILHIVTVALSGHSLDMYPFLLLGRLMWTVLGKQLFKDPY